jgi:hypothetical protein
MEAREMYIKMNQDLLAVMDAYYASKSELKRLVRDISDNGVDIGTFQNHQLQLFCNR